MVKGFCFSRTYLLVEFWSALGMVRNTNYYQLACKKTGMKKLKKEQNKLVTLHRQNLDFFGEMQCCGSVSKGSGSALSLWWGSGSESDLSVSCGWILLLIKVLEICDHWHTDPPRLHFEPSWLWCGSGSPFWFWCVSGSGLLLWSGSGPSFPKWYGTGAGTGSSKLMHCIL